MAAPARGVVLLWLVSALYGSQSLFFLISALTLAKRQPDGAGRRCPAASP